MSSSLGDANSSSSQSPQVPADEVLRASREHVRSIFTILGDSANGYLTAQGLEYLEAELSKTGLNEFNPKVHSSPDGVPELEEKQLESDDLKHAPSLEMQIVLTALQKFLFLGFANGVSDLRMDKVAEFDSVKKDLTLSIASDILKVVNFRRLGSEIELTDDIFERVQNAEENMSIFVTREDNAQEVNILKLLFQGRAMADQLPVDSRVQVNRSALLRRFALLESSLDGILEDVQEEMGKLQKSKLTLQMPNVYLGLGSEVGSVPMTDKIYRSFADGHLTPQTGFELLRDVLYDHGDTAEDGEATRKACQETQRKQAADDEAAEAERRRLKVKDAALSEEIARKAAVLKARETELEAKEAEVKETKKKVADVRKLLLSAEKQNQKAQEKAKKRREKDNKSSDEEEEEDEEEDDAESEDNEACDRMEYKPSTGEDEWAFVSPIDPNQFYHCKEKWDPDVPFKALTGQEEGFHAILRKDWKVHPGYKDFYLPQHDVKKFERYLEIHLRGKPHAGAESRPPAELGKLASVGISPGWASQGGVPTCFQDFVHRFYGEYGAYTAEDHWNFKVTNLHIQARLEHTEQSEEKGLHVFLERPLFYVTSKDSVLSRIIDGVCSHGGGGRASRIESRHCMRHVLSFLTDGVQRIFRTGKGVHRNLGFCPQTHKIHFGIEGSASSGKGKGKKPSDEGDQCRYLRCESCKHIHCIARIPFINGNILLLSRYIEELFYNSAPRTGRVVAPPHESHPLRVLLRRLLNEPLCSNGNNQTFNEAHFAKTIEIEGAVLTGFCQEVGVHLAEDAKFALDKFHLHCCVGSQQTGYHVADNCAPIHPQSPHLSGDNRARGFPSWAICYAYNFRHYEPHAHFYSSESGDAEFPHDWNADGQVASGFGASGIPVNDEDLTIYRQYKHASKDHKDFMPFDLTWDRDWRKYNQGGFGYSRFTGANLDALWEYWTKEWEPDVDPPDPYAAYSKNESVPKVLAAMVKTAQAKRASDNERQSWLERHK